MFKRVPLICHTESQRDNHWLWWTHYVIFAIHSTHHKESSIRSSRVWHLLAGIAGIASHLQRLSVEYLRALEGVLRRRINRASSRTRHIVYMSAFALALNTMTLQGSILIIRMPSVAYVQQTPFCCQSDSYNSKTSNTLSHNKHTAHHPLATILPSLRCCPSCTAHGMTSIHHSICNSSFHWRTLPFILAIVKLCYPYSPQTDIDTRNEMQQSIAHSLIRKEWHITSWNMNKRFPQKEPPLDSESAIQAIPCLVMQPTP